MDWTKIGQGETGDEANSYYRHSQFAHQGRCESLFSKVLAEEVWFGNFSLPPLSIELFDSFWLRDQDKRDEDEQSLESHKDGENVCKHKKLLNFYHQNANDPGDTHHHTQRDAGL